MSKVMEHPETAPQELTSGQYGVLSCVVEGIFTLLTSEQVGVGMYILHKREHNGIPCFPRKSEK
jgi:hypothetical protein